MALERKTPGQASYKFWELPGEGEWRRAMLFELSQPRGQPHGGKQPHDKEGCFRFRLKIPKYQRKFSSRILAWLIVPSTTVMVELGPYGGTHFCHPSTEVRFRPVSSQPGI